MRGSDALLVIPLELREERQGKRPPARVFGDGTEALGEPVRLAHVRLQVDAREVLAALDPLLGEFRPNPRPVDALVEQDDVDEPQRVWSSSSGSGVSTPSIPARSSS